MILELVLRISTDISTIKKRILKVFPNLGNGSEVTETEAERAEELNGQFIDVFS